MFRDSLRYCLYLGEPCVFLFNINFNLLKNKSQSIIEFKYIEEIDDLDGTHGALKFQNRIKNKEVSGGCTYF